jgi:hypothetical protein
MSYVAASLVLSPCGTYRGQLFMDVCMQYTGRTTRFVPISRGERKKKSSAEAQKLFSSQSVFAETELLSSGTLPLFFFCFSLFSCLGGGGLCGMAWPESIGLKHF